MAKMKVDVKDGTIGPAHDPYGTHCVTVEVEDKKATWYYDGLGRNQVILSLRGEIKRDLSWNDVTYSKDSANKEALAKILFRRHVGITATDAEGEYCHRYHSDPYGGPASYY